MTTSPPPTNFVSSCPAIPALGARSRCSARGLRNRYAGTRTRPLRSHLRLTLSWGEAAQSTTPRSVCSGPAGTHRRLAEEYRANRRLGLNYDDMAPGLSQYIHDAILANCRRGTRSAAR
ncbi:TipAS antibiotic-recognition domain-containing protein [Nocardia nova]|uniref:TipAS antibiotic-recognition domain-containing protein n=1 Tax=Nocardia nova TaxID=37330 RepID=UPI0034DDB507